MKSAPVLDFRHSPLSFRQLSHAVLAFIRGAGVRWGCCCLRCMHAAVLVDGLGARLRGHDERGRRAWRRGGGHDEMGGHDEI
jgi:hypothetical protein